MADTAVPVPEATIATIAAADPAAVPDVLPTAIVGGDVSTITSDVPVVRTEGMVLVGSMKVWNIAKGFGFASVSDGGGDLFVHQSAVEVENNRFRAVLPGTEVAMTYSLREGKDTAKSCTSSDGSKLPGFSSKLEASQQIAGGDLGTTPTMGGPALGLPVGFYAGVIKFWNADKGFGFVVPEGGGDDVFVHVRDVDQMQVLNQGDQVIFRLEQKNQGPRPQAVQVSLRNAPRTPAIPQQAAAAYDPYGAAAANPYGYPAAGAYAQQAAYGAAAAYPGYGAPDQYSQQAAYSPYGASAATSYPGSAGVDAYGMPLPAATSTPVAPSATGGAQSGTCKWFNEEKGFGFIIPSSGGPDIYFKGQDVNATSSLQENEPVSYELKIAPDGKQWAIRVTRMEQVGAKRKLDNAAPPVNGGLYGGVGTAAAAGGYMANKRPASHTEMYPGYSM